MKFIAFTLLLAGCTRVPEECKSGPPFPSNSCLDEGQKQVVKSSYKNLLNAHEKKDFDRMLAEVGQIHQLVNEYNDTNAYEAIANRGKSGR